MTYFRRNIDAKLKAWKDSRRRKPLLLRGARQIGKSSSVRHLGRGFKYFIEVNFETQKHMIQLFEQETDLKGLCEKLSILFSTPVIEGETLLFLDEIQKSEPAIKSLWSFKEQMPGLHVVAAGSLLEFALKKLPSYGVGRVSSMFMYPMAYEEFLDAVGKGEWNQAIKAASPENPLFTTLHDELVSLYRTFLMIGGMPASVKAWVETGDYRECMLLSILDLDFGGAQRVNQLILAGSEEDLVNKGKLAELSIGWELVKASDFRHRYELYYWENLSNGATSEVDYVIPFDMNILPIEVKSGTSGKMKSLRLFMQKKRLTMGIRTSLENFGRLRYEDQDASRTIRIIPIYAIGRLTSSMQSHNF